MTSPAELFLIGMALLKQGEYRQAAELAANAVLDFPDDGKLWELLGVARHHQGESDGARQALETASLLRPLDIGARFVLAETYAAAEMHELATFMFKLVGHDPLTPLWLLPRVASRLGQLQEHAAALAICRTVVRRDSKRHEAHFGIGFYLSKLGRPKGSVAAALARAHELAPDVPLYRIVLASLWQELGRKEEAYDLLRNLPPESVRCAASLKRMMQVFDAASDRSRSDACLRRVRELEQNFPHDGDDPLC